MVDRKSKKLNYHCIEACNYSIQYKDQENLVVLVPNTVINPYTVVVLHRKICETAVKINMKKKMDLHIVLVIVTTILRTHLLQTRQWCARGGL